MRSLGKERAGGLRLHGKDDGTKGAHGVEFSDHGAVPRDVECLSISLTLA